ncbi:MAG: hypothetical protein Q7I93_05685 [Syntrophales bacterium]|nr:hypothetical protein [Syntrophales bacterium]
MPNRIEHEIRDGVETKRCAECRDYLPLKQFHSTGEGNTWDGLFAYCIECTRKRRNDDLRRKATLKYSAIRRRIAWPNYRRKGIELKVGREEFIQWYSENYFRGGVVDRIDDKGHYELGNIHIITPIEHNRKKRKDRLDALGIIETWGRYCYGCDQEKSHDDFYRKKAKVSEWNPLGLSELCAECTRKKRTDNYEKEKHHA